MKADTKVIYEKNKPEKFTNFELLQAEVEVIKESLDEIAEIMKENDLYGTRKIEAKGFDGNKAFEMLEE